MIYLLIERLDSHEAIIFVKVLSLESVPVIELNSLWRAITMSHKITTETIGSWSNRNRGLHFAGPITLWLCTFLWNPSYHVYAHKTQHKKICVLGIFIVYLSGACDNLYQKSCEI